LNRPRVRGKIINVIRAEWRNEKLGIHQTAFWVYVYLTNYHKNAISLLDYECEIDFGQGYAKLERVYGDVSKAMPETLTVKGFTGQEFQLSSLGQHLLYKSTEPVRFGRFKHGFVMFAGDLSFHDKKEKKVRFACIDVFNRKHVLEARFDEYFNVNLLLELLDVAPK
jgi:hypothetical protein